ncbi:hypothetical protein K438DRAFT_1783683 [Mycena galopus ATCC 62051]|nr:hypothetical protein K438DRAFT_1783683 [Mycena galopus ATCC 62051]
MIQRGQEVGDIERGVGSTWTADAEFRRRYHQATAAGVRKGSDNFGGYRSATASKKATEITKRATGVTVALEKDGPRANGGPAWAVRTYLDGGRMRLHGISTAGGGYDPTSKPKACCPALDAVNKGQGEEEGDADAEAGAFAGLQSKRGK